MSESFPMGTRVRIGFGWPFGHAGERGVVCQCMHDTVVVDLGCCQMNCDRRFLEKLRDDGITKGAIVRVQRYCGERFDGRYGMVKELHPATAYVDFGDDNAASIKHDAMIDVARMLSQVMDGKPKLQISILLKADEISTLILDIGQKFANPSASEDFTEEKLNEVLDYFEMVKTGLAQYAAQNDKGGEKDA